MFALRSRPDSLIVYAWDGVQLNLLSNFLFSSVSQIPEIPGVTPSFVNFRVINNQWVACWNTGLPINGYSSELFTIFNMNILGGVPQLNPERVNYWVSANTAAGDVAQVNSQLWAAIGTRDGISYNYLILFDMGASTHLDFSSVLKPYAMTSLIANGNKIFIAANSGGAGVLVITDQFGVDQAQYASNCGTMCGVGLADSGLFIAQNTLYQVTGTTLSTRPLNNGHDGEWATFTLRPTSDQIGSSGTLSVSTFSGSTNTGNTITVPFTVSALPLTQVIPAPQLNFSTYSNTPFSFGINPKVVGSDPVGRRLELVSGTLNNQPLAASDFRIGSVQYSKSVTTTTSAAIGKYFFAENGVVLTGWYGFFALDLPTMNLRYLQQVASKYAFRAPNGDFVFVGDSYNSASRGRYNTTSGSLNIETHYPPLLMGLLNSVSYNPYAERIYVLTTNSGVTSAYQFNARNLTAPTLWTTNLSGQPMSDLVFLQGGAVAVSQDGSFYSVTDPLNPVSMPMKTGAFSTSMPIQVLKDRDGSDRYAVVLSGGKVQFWDVKNNSAPTAPVTSVSSSVAIQAFTFSNDQSKLFFTDSQGILRVHEIHLLQDGVSGDTLLRVAQVNSYSTGITNPMVGLVNDANRLLMVYAGTTLIDGSPVSATQFTAITSPFDFSVVKTITSASGSGVSPLNIGKSLEFQGTFQALDSNQAPT
ncbi:MAG: hypothetical protein EBX40_04910, partial [Gammaproteobacteria bacterium]|nr:hypothetical protein [Gammaproteobacteria bacterium]